MGRKRFVSPEFFKHPELFDAEVSSGLPLRLAFAGLWCQCDRRGVFAWSARALKTDILPHDDVNFDAVLSALMSAGFISCYEVNGKRYGWVPSFPRWQSFHKNEPESNLPGPSLGRAVDAVNARISIDSAQKPTNGGPTPSIGCSTPSPSTAVTVASTVTSTVVSCTSGEGPGGVADLNHDARLLTIAANAGLDRRYPHRNPLHSSSGHALSCAEALRVAGVDREFAAAAIFAYASTMQKDTPPKSMNYFTRHVIERWRSEIANRDAASFVAVERPSAEVDQMRTFAVRYARDGSTEWQAYCDERAIDWRPAA